MSAQAVSPSDHSVTVEEYFGENVFSLATMEKYLSDTAFQSLRQTIETGSELDASIADEVAGAMKEWATQKGATHFTHWFQPLTGATAEKHDSFIMPDRKGGVLLQFSGKELIQGEPDASSFPSGGLRVTFEARGYTAWDPNSPAFIKECDIGATLCIPSVFCGYNGESLDKKMPLLRSMQVLSDQFCRLGRLFGIDCPGKRAYATLGAEQEYFLVDLEFYSERLDLIQTGRTLFGSTPAKHQQMDDHYFGSIKRRVLNFMTDLDCQLWRLGIPAKTRHNEVCPGQFEIASVFEELNLAVDHNMIVMDVLNEVAATHGFACLLHEKPFAGVNGSGKHNNWNVTGPDGKNWFKPGDSPHDNAKFLAVICSVIKAVDVHSGLLRASVASAGNDHRLGANEAPPAIISIFLGDQLMDVMEQIEKGGASSSRDGGTIEVGVSSLPRLPRDATDRNRTSPFAFTGNKFEFRALGSSASCAGANIVLNTIVAEALDQMCTELESAVKGGADFNESLQQILQEIIVNHKQVLFNGDNYTEQWHREAEKRGLPNLRTTPEALKEIVSDKTVALFEKYGVLSRRELESRFEVYSETYAGTIAIEAHCARTMGRTMIASSALEFQKRLSETLAAMIAVGETDLDTNKAMLSRVTKLYSRINSACDSITASLDASNADGMLDGMQELRSAADELEGLCPDDIWPLPSYAEMMFIQ